MHKKHEKKLLNYHFVGLPLQAHNALTGNGIIKPHEHGISVQVVVGVERGKTVELFSDTLRIRNKCDVESRSQ